MVAGKIGKGGVSNYANVTTGWADRTFAVSGAGVAPQGVLLSTTNVPVGTPVGTAIARISAQGSTFPYSYTILSDPDAKFSITAPDTLVLAGALSPLTLTHTVQIQAANPFGTLAKTFTITVVV